MWVGTISTCTTQANGTCVDGTQTLTYGCWGPGTTPTPTLAPGDPTPTPIPPLCPNGQCDIEETCSSCPADCGACSTASVKARAVTVGADISCAAIAASTQYVSGTKFSLSPNVDPATQTQSGGSYVSWGSVPIAHPVSGDAYTVSSTPPWWVTNVLRNACYTKDAGATYAQGLSATIFPTETVTWELGYGPPGPWVQTGGGGDVYAAGEITSLVPSGASPRSFALGGEAPYPGVVTYGTSYDFDPSSGSNGETHVSSKNWLVGATRPPLDYYEYFRHKLGPPTTVDVDHHITPLSQPASRPQAYVVSGDMTTAGDWTAGDGERLILMVDGNLTIGGKITPSGTGFAAFIVKGNITVEPSVGVPSTSDTPVVEGLYVTSPTGTFITGDSSSPGTERFVGI